MRNTEENTAAPAENTPALDIAQLRQLGQALNAAVFEWDFTHGTVFFSKECEKYTLGHEDPETVLQNRAGLQNVHPADVPAIMEFFRKSDEHLPRVEALVRLRMVDGSYRRSRLIGLFNYDENGALATATGLILDIENEEPHNLTRSTFLNAIPTGVGIYEVAGGKATQLYMNDGFYRLVRDTREARIARSDGAFLNSIYPDDRATVADSVRRVAQGEDEVSVICRAYTGDGGITWLRFTASAAQRKEDYILVYAVYSGMDDEMNTRRLMQQRQSMLNAAINSAKMSVWEYDVPAHSVSGSIGSLHQHGNRKVIYNVPEMLIESGYVRPDYADAYRALFRDVVEKNTTVQGDFPVREDILGTEDFWWERVILTPVTDIEGKVVKAIGVSIDVSEQKSREERYRKQLDAMMTTNDEDIIGKGQYNITRNTALYFNPLAPNAVHAESDARYDDVVRSIQGAALYPEGREALGRAMARETLLQNFNEGKTDSYVEYARSAVDGSTAWARTHITLFEEPESQDIIAFSYSYDITEQVLEQRIIEHLSDLEYDVLGAIDVKTRFFKLRRQEAGSRLGRFMPYEDYDTLVSQRIAGGVPPEEREAVQAQICLAAVLKNLQSTNTYAVTYSMRDKNGALRRKKSLYCYLDDEKSTIFFCRTDITDIFLKEQEQLRQTQLALEAAQAASQAKTDFLSNMSHDMRTPMNGIIGMVELALANEKDPQQVHESLSIIRTSSMHLLQLINDILDMSRIEAGRIKLENKGFSQHKEISGVVSAVQVLAQENGLQFTDDIDIKHDVCIGDPEKLHRILSNILSNAIKFTPQGGHVSLKVQELAHSNPHMRTFRYIVEDDGIGMSDETQAHMFDTFYRADTEYVGKTEGTGLGLSIVKNIVELAGGTIRVASTPHKGSCFTIDIPMPISYSGGIGSSALQPQPHSGLRYNLSGVRILLVEDHPINRVVAQRILEKVGAEVTCAENGREALDYFMGEDGRSTDIILMDIQMPVMNGYEAAQAIRACGCPNAATVPIIAMTANAFAADIRKCFDCGMNEHVPKPIRPEELYAAICHYAGNTETAPKPRILIVDDMEVNIAVIRQALEDEYDIVSATDGNEALEALAQYENIIAVITDIQMPNMNGTELIRAIRRSHAYDNIAILANTQYGDSSQEEELLALGADDFVYKPTTPLIVYTRLRNILMRYNR